MTEAGATEAGATEVGATSRYSSVAGHRSSWVLGTFAEDEISDASRTQACLPFPNGADGGP